MKDYYKILGVNEDASTEEIRARWIALTKHYHPDLRKTNREDGKIKEINEAYEVLKDYSKRLDYDLQRAIKKSIGKKIQAEERKVSLTKKAIFYTILMVFLLMVGFILFKSQQVPVQPKSELRFEISKVLEKRSVPPVPSPQVKEEVPPPSLSPAEKESKRKEEAVPKKVMKPEPPEKVDKELPEEAIPVFLPSEETLLPEAEEEEEAPKEIAPVISQEKTRPDPPRPIVTEPQPVQKPQPVQEAKPVRVPETPAKAEKVFFPLPPFLAKEEEVKQFLSNYINRYIRKDIDGFLSFFSSKAVQNQKDDFEKIRSIYTKFFDQSEELRYGLEGLKIEIYQNLVEVKARYRVYQRLKKQGVEKLWKGNIRWVLVKEEEALQISLLDYQDEKSP